MTHKRLWEVAEELGTDVLTVVKLAKNLGMASHSFSKRQINELERKLSGFDDLSDSDLRDLEDFFYSEKGKALLSSAAQLMGVIDDLDSGKEKKYLLYVAERLYEQIDKPELKQKVKPITIYETIRNLGVIEFYRSGAATPEQQKEVPVDLLKFDNDFAYHYLKKQLLGVLERSKLENPQDFDRAHSQLSKEYRRLSDYVRTSKP